MLCAVWLVAAFGCGVLIGPLLILPDVRREAGVGFVLLIPLGLVGGLLFPRDESFSSAVTWSLPPLIPIWAGWVAAFIPGIDGNYGLLIFVAVLNAFGAPGFLPLLIVATVSGQAIRSASFFRR